MFNSLHTFSGSHLARRPPILTAILACHIYLFARALSVCVCVRVCERRWAGWGGIWRWCGGSLHTSILSPAAHPVEKLALITAVCLSHQHAPLPTQIESNHRQLLKGGGGRSAAERSQRASCSCQPDTEVRWAHVQMDPPTPTPRASFTPNFCAGLIEILLFILCFFQEPIS